MTQAAFHIVTVYKGVHTIIDANWRRKAAFHIVTVYKGVLSIIDANWRRKNILRSFQMFAFLDDLGSRYRPSNVPFPVASAWWWAERKPINIVEVKMKQ